MKTTRTIAACIAAALLLVTVHTSESSAETVPIDSLPTTNPCNDFFDGWSSFRSSMGGIPIEFGRFESMYRSESTDSCRLKVLGGRYTRVYGVVGALDSSGSRKGFIRIYLDDVLVVDTPVELGSRVNVDLDTTGVSQLRITTNCTGGCEGSGNLRTAYSLVAVEPDDFSDVGQVHPFYEQIRWATSRGITNGYPNGTFGTTGAVTRQAIAAFLYRMEGAPPGIYPNPGFTDVGIDHPFATPISWAISNDLTTGYPDQSYRPSAAVTRQALATFLYRLAGSPPGPFPNPGLTDVSASHPFYDAIAWAIATGVAEGYDDNSFRPSAPVSRQAAAAFLARL